MLPACLKGGNDGADRHFNDSIFWRVGKGIFYEIVEHFSQTSTISLYNQLVAGDPPIPILEAQVKCALSLNMRRVCLKGQKTLFGYRDGFMDQMDKIDRRTFNRDGICVELRHF